MAPTKLTSSSSSRTPQKSTKSSSSSGFVSKTPLSAKTKPKPNGSILNYFKKAADESLFIAEGVVADSPAPEPEKEDDNDIYGASDADGSGIQLRFNEVTSSVKKRKLSPQPQDEEGDESPSKQSLPERQNEEHKSPESLPPQNPRPKKSAKTTKKKNNPFLDDSSDDDDDGGDRNDDISTPKSGTSDISQTALKTAATTTTVRPLPNTTMPCTPERSKLTSKRPAFSRSDVPLLRQETSGNNVRDSEDRDDDFDPDMQADYEGDGQFADQFGEGDEDDDLFAGGEEFKEMRYMQEQARLAAEEGNHSFDGDDDNLGPDAMVESCPICNGSLSGVTEDQATAHVNACLDGNPTPLPTAASLPKTEQEKRESGGVSVEAPDLGKRFAKAAVARPGQANPINLGGTAASVDGGPSKSAFAKLMTSHAEDSAWATAAAAEQASRGKPAYKRTCPFYKIMPGFSICVDAFRYGAVEGCKAYFLSHFHSDHYMGLTAHWTHGPIYCSKVTGALVKMQLKTAAKYVVELAFDETAPVPGTQGVTVTMIPANHCPGSSLFLFEKSVGGTRTQRILHCGDFRACPAHVEHPQLRPETTASAIAGKTKQQKIDVCYLDTTYLNPRYSFPPQEDVVRSCAEVCLSLDKGLTAEDDRAWNSLLRRREGGGGTTENVSKFFPSEKTKPPPLAAGKDNTPSSDLKSAPDNAFTGLKQGGGRKNRLLVVCGTYSIGKERICKAIALALKTKIYASAAKIRMCQQLDDAQLADLMTSNPREAQVHMQMLMEIRPETLAEYLELHRAHGFSRVVGFRPSGWNFRPNNGGGSGGGGGGIASGIVVGANMPPSSVPSTSLLHGTGWRPRFAASSLVPQRGSSGDAMCFGVPYSEHSSFRELALFLMALRIDKVVPTVNVGSEQSRRRMKAWTDRWLAERRRGGLVRVLKEGEGGVDGGEALWDGKQGTGGGVFW